jgi:hypothetical protein
MVVLLQNDDVKDETSTTADLTSEYFKPDHTISEASPPSTLRGMTKADIAGAKTAALTARLQIDISNFAARIAEETPQYLHAIRQIDDMVGEVSCGVIARGESFSTC